MNKFASVIALACSALLSIGCNNIEQTAPPTAAAKPSAGIAIIDLDEVARQLGSDKKIVNAIKQRESALNTKLVELAQNYTSEFKKQKEAIEAQAQNQEGEVQLATYKQQVNQNFKTARAQAQQNLSQHRQKLIGQFREAVRPTARKVAQQRGLSVIVTQQDSLLYDFDPECDITDDVVKALRASTAAKKTAAQEPANKQG